MAKAKAARKTRRDSSGPAAAGGGRVKIGKSATMATRAQAARTLAQQDAAPAKRPAASAKRSTSVRLAPGKRGKAAKSGKTAVRGGLLKRGAVPPERVIKIRELDPYAKCGPDTSVMELYRVDEAVNGSKHVHLVFFDRHGWYCLHGRACPAVNDVRRMDRAHSVRTH